MSHASRAAHIAGLIDREIQSAAQNLPQLITEIETSFRALKPHLRDNDGKVRRFINFYGNEEDIRFLGNDEYAFKDGRRGVSHSLHRRRLKPCPSPQTPGAPYLARFSRDVGYHGP